MLVRVGTFAKQPMSRRGQARAKLPRERLTGTLAAADPAPSRHWFRYNVFLGGAGPLSFVVG